MDPNAVKKIKNSVQMLTTVLMDILRNPATRSQSIANFQKEVWKVDASGEEFPELRILRDLALDLDYYGPGVEPGREGSCCYGDEQLEAKISATLRRLTQPYKVKQP